MSEGKAIEAAKAQSLH